MDIDCRAAAAREKERALQEKQHRREKAAEEGLAGKSGPVVAAESTKTARRQKQEQRQGDIAAGVAGKSGPMPAAEGGMSARKQKQEQRQEAIAAGVAGKSGPVAAAESGMSARKQKHEQRQEAIAAGVAGKSGPVAAAESTKTARKKKQEQRQADIAASVAGKSGPVTVAESTKTARKQKQEQRREDIAEGGAGARGPLQHLESRRAIRHLKASMGPHHKLGPPYDIDVAADYTRTSLLSIYKKFIVDWEQFGLSVVCERCLQLSTGSHCQRRQDGVTVCERCKTAGNDARALPLLAPIPPSLASLIYMERQLISTTKTSQCLLSLPSGGPTGQWGRKYVTALPEPQVCEVMAGAEVSADGVIYVKQPGTLQACPARLPAIVGALRTLHDTNALYKSKKILDLITELEAKLPAAEATDDDPLQVELDYMITPAPAQPPAIAIELQKTRGSAEMQDNLDAKVFPHLFPDGTGGIQSSRKWTEYIRARLLNVDDRFEQSPDYIYFLLEFWLKKKVAGNTAVRIGPIRQSKVQDAALRHAVYTTMRDIPGTQPYMYTKRSMAISMFEQLGPPQWFLTLTCHARQPSLLLACIYAKLLRRRGESETRELLRTEAAVVLHEFMHNPEHQWEDMTANQLCNAHPAIVARQFFHQVRRFMRWLAPTTPEEEVPRRDGAEDAEDTAAAADESTADPPCVLGPSVQEVAGVAPPFAVQDYVIRIEWQKRGYPHAHILVWTDDKPSQADAPDTNTAEMLIDKYICTTSPNRWKHEELPVMEKLAEMVVHKHSAYCGRCTLGACRFGFP